MEVGAVVGQRFVIESLAGSGGMGSVYRAKDTISGDTVALKILRDFSPEAHRFVREATTLSKLRHPGIVRYVESRVDGGEPSFIAMQWLEGPNLAEALSSGPLPPNSVIQLGLSIASALEAAHNAGIVHRDLKPNNVILVDGAVERAVLVDFGIAHLAGDQRMTRTGIALGTPGYMAPEQVRGEAALDARSDLFALGCLLYEAAVGRGPFVAEHAMAMLARILFDSPAPARELRAEIPGPLSSLLMDLLEKDPDARPTRANEVIAALRALGDGAPTQPLSIPPAPPVSLSSKEQRLISIIAAGGRPELAPTAPWTPVASAISASAPTIRSVAGRFGGRVEYLASGTWITVLSGRGSLADQAARAARCALSMQALLPDAPMMVATGRGIVGGVLPLGELIDRAIAGLGDATQPSITVDDRTAELLDERFELEAWGGGRRLLGERADLSPKTLLGSRVELVGRKRELDVLRALFTSCFEERRAALGLIVGDAGIGKTSLAEAALRALPSGSIAPHITRVACDAYGALGPFGAVGGLVRDASIGPLFETAEGQGDALRVAFLDWIAERLRSRPLVLFIEDLHWGDQLSVEWLDAAAARFADSPLLLLAVARPQIHDRFPRLWRGRGLLTMQLAPLSHAASLALLRIALKDRNPRDLVPLAERSGGNPLFLEELARATVERKDDVISDTLLGAIASRFDAQPPACRRTLRAVSVYGERIPAEAIVALTGEPQLSAETDRIAQLVDAELLELSSDDEQLVAFRHDLVRQAAYATLPEADRVLAHRLAGEWLSSQGEPSDQMLAYHYERGGVRDQARHHYHRAASSALAAQAFESALSLADKALALEPSGEQTAELLCVQADAHQWRGRVFESGDSAGRAAELAPLHSASWFRAKGLWAFGTAPRGSAQDIRRIALEVADAPLPSDRAIKIPRIEALCRIGLQLFLLGEYALGNRMRDAARLDPTASSSESPLVQARVLQLDAFTEFFGGRLELAAEHFEQAADVYGRNSLVGFYSTTLQHGFVLVELGQFEAAANHLGRALTAIDRLGMDAMRPMLSTLYAFALMRAGGPFEQEFRKMPPAPIEELDIRADGGTSMNAALIYLELGKPEEALEAAGRAIRAMHLFRPIGARALGARATVLLRLGRIAEAKDDAERGMALLADLGSMPTGEGMLRLAHAEALAESGDRQGAAKAIEAAAARLTERAASLSNDELRETFFSVPEHAATMERMRAWSKSPPV